MNRSWHKENPMPKKPTLKASAKWHLADSMKCGCRPIPKSVRDFLKRKIAKAEFFPTLGKRIVERERNEMPSANTTTG